jgi:hypothetical protein
MNKDAVISSMGQAWAEVPEIGYEEALANVLATGCCLIIVDQKAQTFHRECDPDRIATFEAFFAYDPYEGYGSRLWDRFKFGAAAGRLKFGYYFSGVWFWGSDEELARIRRRYDELWRGMEGGWTERITDAALAILAGDLALLGTVAALDAVMVASYGAGAELIGTMSPLAFATAMVEAPVGFSALAASTAWDAVLTPQGLALAVVATEFFSGFLHDPPRSPAAAAGWGVANWQGLEDAWHDMLDTF